MLWAAFLLLEDIECGGGGWWSGVVGMVELLSGWGRVVRWFFCVRTIFFYFLVGKFLFLTKPANLHGSAWRFEFRPSFALPLMKMAPSLAAHYKKGAVKGVDMGHFTSRSEGGKHHHPLLTHFLHYLMHFMHIMTNCIEKVWGGGTKTKCDKKKAGQ